MTLNSLINDQHILCTNYRWRDTSIKKPNLSFICASGYQPGSATRFCLADSTAVPHLILRPFYISETHKRLRFIYLYTIINLDFVCSRCVRYNNTLSRLSLIIFGLILVNSSRFIQESLLYNNIV